jgi:hypothetical protein
MEERATLPQLCQQDEWDGSSRPKSSQDVVETSLQSLVPSTDMASATATDTGIGDGARVATLMGGEAATRPLAVRSAGGRLQRVRAFMRVTRRATGPTYGRWVWTGGAMWLTPHGSRREPVTLLFDAGGPGLLTEDRQKPRSRFDRLASGASCRSGGMHGTRNTVHSIAFVGANRGLRCGCQGVPSRSQ